MDKSTLSNAKGIKSTLNNATWIKSTLSITYLQNKILDVFPIMKKYKAYSFLSSKSLHKRFETINDSALKSLKMSNHNELVD